MSRCPPLGLSQAENALRGSVSFPGFYDREDLPADIRELVELKRLQGLRVRVVPYGGRFHGDTQGTTKVSFWFVA